MQTHNTFGQDVEFLKRHVQTIVLGDSESQIAVVPAYQGRTMTSTTGGPNGKSFGWLNYARIASKDIDPKVNLYGGEDRIWISPEGGQFSVFFQCGDPLDDFAYWQPPRVIDSEPFDVVDQSPTSIVFSRQSEVINYSQFKFQMEIQRSVRLLSSHDIAQHLGCELGSETLAVAHESQNTLRNIGPTAWNQVSGVLGIWVLGMCKPAPDVTIVIPFKPGPVDQLGPVVNAGYFGVLDQRRLIVDHNRSLIYFLGDGRFRSKLGLTFARVRPTIGSWEPSQQTLNLTQFNLPDRIELGYTNNLWKFQDDPFSGDVINSYNDGPNESGEMLGPFYELETLSPALPLAPNQSYTHVHRTMHLEGKLPQIDRIANHVFGVGLQEIDQQFQ